MWLAYDVGGKNFSKHLGTIEASEDDYTNIHGEFYKILMKDKNILSDFIYKMAQALDEVQSINYVHSDIKPDNIWLESPNARVKIIDFGLARTIEDAEFTASGSVVGRYPFSGDADLPMHTRPVSSVALI